jgi:hypothetical protein
MEEWRGGEREKQRKEEREERVNEFHLRALNNIKQ